MIIFKENIDQLKNLPFHDMELLDIIIDYCDHSVKILLNEPQGNMRTLLFKHMQSFLIGVFEPWGEGIYVNEIKVIISEIEKLIPLSAEFTIKDGAFLTEILINSGDKIQVLSTEIQFE